MSILNFILNLLEHEKSLITSGPDFGQLQNSADPVQTPQNVASDQRLHCLLTGTQYNGAKYNKSELILREPWNYN